MEHIVLKSGGGSPIHHQILRDLLIVPQYLGSTANREAVAFGVKCGARTVSCQERGEINYSVQSLGLDLYARQSQPAAQMERGTQTEDQLSLKCPALGHCYFCSIKRPGGLSSDSCAVVGKTELELDLLVTGSCFSIVTALSSCQNLQYDNLHENSRGRGPFNRCRCLQEIIEDWYFPRH